MGFTFYIGDLRVFFPYDSIYPEQCLVKSQVVLTCRISVSSGNIYKS